MPKIASNGNPSYEGHEGVVTNAVGEQFEVNPHFDLEGNEAPDLVVEEPGTLDEEPLTSTGDIRPSGYLDTDENGEATAPRRTTDPQADDRDDTLDPTNTYDPKKDGNQMPAIDTPREDEKVAAQNSLESDTPKKATPAKKATASNAKSDDKK